MKTVRNLTKLPIRIPLPRRKVLHLAPGKTGQIKDDAAEHAAFKKLVEEGKVEIVVGGGRGSGPLGSSKGIGQGSSHSGGTAGHHKSGDR